MRIPRPRFTVRWLMVAVAIVAVVLGWHEERRSRFGRLSIEHDLARKAIPVSDLELYLLTHRPGESIKSYNERRQDADALFRFIDYHNRMAGKYEVASRRPWFPVANDPPAPPKPGPEYVKRIRVQYGLELEQH